MDLLNKLHLADASVAIPIAGMFVLFVVFILVFRFLLKPRFVSKDRLMSVVEARMLNKLKPLEGGRYYLFAQVRVADVIGVGGKEGSSSWWSLFRQISSKHVDFVFVERSTMRPVVAIELDDLSHNKPDRIVRDKFLNKAFEQAGTKLVRYTTKQLFDNSLDFRLLGL